GGDNGAGFFLAPLLCSFVLFSSRKEGTVLSALSPCGNSLVVSTTKAVTTRASRLSPRCQRRHHYAAAAKGPLRLIVMIRWPPWPCRPNSTSMPRARRFGAIRRRALPSCWGVCGRRGGESKNDSACERTA